MRGRTGRDVPSAHRSNRDAVLARYSSQNAGAAQEEPCAGKAVLEHEQAEQLAFLEINLAQTENGTVSAAADA